MKDLPAHPASEPDEHLLLLVAHHVAFDGTSKDVLLADLAAAYASQALPASEIFLYRDLAFDDTQLLAKEQEEILLYRDMLNDLVQQLLRRLSAAKMPAAAPTP